ncbi:site-specific DNA-methyltransferase [Ruegeria aquimaris]|uniref:Methyltransferase n=1 Tax=Ruegeria aquimaris TaxID=2984333 RepID=A0ABT3ANK3_9RHOB|nr:DNA methyltransferase [Ruegeria sp. XHP0148]MCV2890231.1 site-specific DNA-methyltransferase [Ruegeria sp. XHP0148]
MGANSKSVMKPLVPHEGMPTVDSEASSKPVWMADKVVQTPVSDLKPYARNNRIHTPKNVDKLKASVEQFGFVTPILIDGDNVIIAGHGRYEAAKALGLAAVPTVVAAHLSPAEVRALRIADNRLAELSDWDAEALQIEFAELMDLGLEGELDFDLVVTGFEMPEIDIIINGAGDVVATERELVEAPDPHKQAVTRPGDLWKLGDHRILCADSLSANSYDRVLAGAIPRMVFTDPPYNVPVRGHVRAGGGNGHREFAMASGEMSETEFRGFLETVFAHLEAALPAGGISMVCMDWRHIEELIAAGKGRGFDLINLCVWNKTNGGMGSLYRSKHEMICIFKKPGAPHLNNVELGKHGRNRTNVWDYAGVNSFGKGREADLVDHPTVKPTALVADAIMDVSQRGDVVLDAFGGSGATLLAAAKTGRKACLIELDPLYVDVAIRRWQEISGCKAVNLETGEAFDDRATALLVNEKTEAENV